MDSREEQRRAQACKIIMREMETEELEMYARRIERNDNINTRYYREVFVWACHEEGSAGE